MVGFSLPCFYLCNSFAQWQNQSLLHLSHKSAKIISRRFSDPAVAPFGFLRSVNKIGRLRNSHDPLRGHVLKQCSPSPPILSPALSATEGV
jgi:hypothetical protein